MPNVLPDDAFNGAEILAQAEAQRAAQQGASGTAQGVQDVPTTTPAPVRPTDALKANPYAEREITLEDGRKVVLQKPKKTLSLYVARLLGIQSQNPTLTAYYKACCHVRQIDGFNIPFPDSAVAIEQIADLLGEEGLDEVAEEVFTGPTAQPDTLDRDQVKN